MNHQFFNGIFKMVMPFLGLQENLYITQLNKFFNIEFKDVTWYENMFHYLMKYHPDMVDLLDFMLTKLEVELVSKNYSHLEKSFLDQLVQFFVLHRNLLKFPERSEMNDKKTLNANEGRVTIPNWELLANGGDGLGVKSEVVDDQVQFMFIPSYEWGTVCQVVDLSENTDIYEYIQKEQPLLFVGTFVDTNDKHRGVVEVSIDLVNDIGIPLISKKMTHEFKTSKDEEDDILSYYFTHYPQETKYVRLTLSGKSKQPKTGHSGPIINRVFVRLIPHERTIRMA
mmetsp:Transcript_16883/g.18938  ORF Transcript_16883/g.18938 Transcript_16883/m.18938 type:complete len:283 (-) Transcript_16883:148-996(-)